MALKALVLCLIFHNINGMHAIPYAKYNRVSLGLKMVENLLFDTTVYTAGHCSLQCLRHPACLTFSYNHLQGQCQGHGGFWSTEAQTQLSDGTDIFQLSGRF